MAEPPGKTLPAPKKALVEGLNNRLCSLILERKITNKAELITYLKEKEGFKINQHS
jgi:arginine repressor